MVFFVGRNEGDEQAVQDIPSIIVSRGKEGLPDQFQEPRPGERYQPFAFDRRQRGILAAGEADDLELALPGLDRGPVVVGRRQFDFARR